jgi:hypothetical protein
LDNDKIHIFEDEYEDEPNDTDLFENKGILSINEEQLLIMIKNPEIEKVLEEGKEAINKLCLIKDLEDRIADAHKKINISKDISLHLRPHERLPQSLRPQSLRPQSLRPHERLAIKMKNDLLILIKNLEQEKENIICMRDEMLLELIKSSTKTDVFLEKCKKRIDESKKRIEEISKITNLSKISSIETQVAIESQVAIETQVAIESQVAIETLVSLETSVSIETDEKWIRVEKKKKQPKKDTTQSNKADIKQYFPKKNIACSLNSCNCNGWHFEQDNGTLQPIFQCRYGTSCNKRCNHYETECNQDCCKFVHLNDIIILEGEITVSQFCEEYVRA